ncbi:protein PBDC1 isoform X1 [Strongylocentrotus purpuratus]|uniref:Polysaccharide biosynthesis domain-containing protein n=2 Tax=Strongylocentrotus purpuratus TaxID=7668 RepID=A0A7M7NV06_STRPU|nr:protein PBDC1 isoform X1 [Strongylocentrotus purpuratus]
MQPSLGQRRPRKRVSIWRSLKKKKIRKSTHICTMAAPTNPADELGNREDVELAWAVKAYHHAETYFNLISSLDSTALRLTKHDDEIHQHFKHDFPDMKIDIIDPDDLKSDEAKKKWRVFCNHFDGTVEDFNYGTILRLNCTEDYSEKNSIFVTRVQFFAIEIARNRGGLNLALRKVSPKATENKEMKETLTNPDDAKTEEVAS